MRPKLTQDKLSGWHIQGMGLMNWAFQSYYWRRKKWRTRKTLKTWTRKDTFVYMKWKFSHESRIQNRSVYSQRSEHIKKSPKAMVSEQALLSEQNRLRRAPLSPLKPVVSCWPAPAPAVSILITKKKSWLWGWMVKFY